jgi:Secretion system C-terminal sorting domain
MKLFILILINLLCNYITAQQIYFNKRIDYNHGYEEGWSILHYNDTTLIVSSTINTRIKLALSFLDSTGSIIQSKIYGDIHHNYYAGGPGSIISTRDGGFACGGSIKDSTGNGNILLYKFNSQGDTEWTRIFGDTTFQSGWQVKQTRDGGYIITGSSGTVDPADDVCLLKLDSIGNIQWWGYYGGHYDDVGLSVIQTSDGGYFVSGYTYSYGPNAGSTFNNCYAVKTDSLGNMLWNKVFGGMYAENFYTCIETKDSNLLVCGLYTNFDPYPQCCFSYAWPYFVKMDFNGNVIWDKKIGLPLFNTGASSIRELPDGSIIASGFTDDTVEFRTKGLILKLSPQGDSLWYRMYEASPGTYSDCWLYDIYPTEDKGFIAVGVLFTAPPDTGTQDTWVLKVDSNGCEVYNCLSTGVSYFQNDNKMLSAYPNPFNEKIIIESEIYNTDERSFLIVSDVIGKEIIRYSLHDGNNKQEINGNLMQAGIYFVSLVNSQGLAASARIIKN